MKKITEKNNYSSINIDTLSISEILNVINNEDNIIPNAVKKVIPNISLLVEDIVLSLNNGGRLFYIGCGTSGRLGILDAVECPPTFSTSSDMIQGIIAGGKTAIFKSVENAEDSEEEAISIVRRKVSSKDILIAISASGQAKFITSALNEAHNIKAKTCLITCNEFKRENFMNHLIKIIVGPEVISGSTRMKAGTATKMILNMITTTVMIKLNKTYGNLMVDLKVSNNKLKNRAINIIKQLTDLDDIDALELLELSKNNTKVAIVMHYKKVSYKKALNLLSVSNGSLRTIIG